MNASPLPTGLNIPAAARDLSASTDLLSVVATDLSQFSRLVRDGKAVEQFEAAVGVLADEVRTHLALASRLIAELEPMVALGRRQRKDEDDQGAS